MIIRDSAEVQFTPVLTHELHLIGDDDGQVRRLGESDNNGTIVVVCSITFLTYLDVHEGRCAMPSHDKIPLAGSFNLRVTLNSGNLVGGTEYGLQVTSCPKDWYFHRPSGRCVECDLDKSICRGGRELPVPKKGFWSDLEHAELGYMYTCNYPGASCAIFTHVHYV